jgi:hypothetical protein
MLKLPTVLPWRAPVSPLVLDLASQRRSSSLKQVRFDSITRKIVHFDVSLAALSLKLLAFKHVFELFFKTTEILPS